MAAERVALPGSARDAVPGAEQVGTVDAQTVITINVVLRRQTDEPGSGADPNDVAQVEALAREYGLAVAGVNLAARTVRLSGTAAQMDSAFGVDLRLYRTGETTYRGREGDIYVPADLAPAVTTVLGLDDRPQARAHFRVHPSASATDGYTPAEVAARYGFPTNVTGAGQTVAVIELGGGYDVDDLRTYFTDQGLTLPTVTAVAVDGAANTPGGDADGEVMLDIEVVGAIAQGAGVVVYFAPNTTDGFYNAVAAAIQDQTYRPSVISISWGQAESDWTAQAMQSYDALFADAGAAGITVYAASGDDGANDNVGGSSLNVDFPASSPNVVGCGGTSLTADSETAWNGNGATGGGVSQQFDLPAYQANAGVPANPAGKPGRGVPDVAGDADPETGYRVRVDGSDTVIGGTSAVAPLWAALTALANEGAAQAVGDPHARLYASPAALRDITSGDNNGYEARAGWDACTGLGVPDGTATVAALQA